MSTDDDEEHAAQQGEAAGRFRVALRAIAFAAALVSLFMLWSGERARVLHDLQLVADPAARPGDVLALRAFVLRDVEAPQGPTLARAPVRVSLVDGKGRELASTELVATDLDSMEGTLRVPDTADGALTLLARATLSGEPPLECQRPLDVSSDAAELPALGREAGALQHMSVGAVRTPTLAPAPEPFLPRVLGGACVPEVPCTLLVWVGEPAAAIALRAGSGVEVLGAPKPAGETSGLVELALRVHGMQAEATLEAHRAGELVADRSVRLPIALGEVALHVAKPLVDASEGAVLSLVLPPGREHAIVDVISAGHWRSSRTLARVDPKRTITLAASELGVGVVRLQARTDRFTSDGSGGRVLYVRSPGEDDAHALDAIAREVTRRESTPQPSDRLVQGIPPALAQDPQRAVAFLLAPLEEQRVLLPTATSGRPAQLARLDHAKTLVRFGVSGMLVLGGLIVGVSLMQRGLRASREATTILDEAARETHETLPSRAGDRLRVVALVLAVCLAFLAGALAIAAKPLWF